METGRALRYAATLLPVRLVAGCVSLLLWGSAAWAQASNANVFVLRDTSTFQPLALDLVQDYAPPGPGALMPPALSDRFVVRGASAAFSSAQTLLGGDTIVELFVRNSGPRPVRGVTNPTVSTGRPIALTRAGSQTGDQLFAIINLASATATVTPPAGWTSVGTTANTGVSTWVFTHRLEASDPLSFSFDLSVAAIDGSSVMLGVRALDATNPIDDAASGQTTGASLTSPSISATVPSTLLWAHFAISSSSGSWTCPVETSPRATSSQLAAPLSFVTCEGFGAAAGPIGPLTATFSTAAPGVTQVIAIRPDSTRTCAPVVRLSRWAEPKFRAATTAEVPNSTSLVLLTPAGVAAGDLMLAVIGTNGPTVSAAGWTPRGSLGNTGYHTSAWSRVATSAEPAQHAFTTSSTTTLTGGIAAYYDVNESAPVVQSQLANAGFDSTTHHTFALQNPPTGITRVVGLFVMEQSGIALTPNSGELRFQSGTAHPVVAMDVLQAAPYQIRATAAAPSSSTGVIFTLGPPAKELGAAPLPVPISSVTEKRTLSFPTEPTTFRDGDRLLLEVTVPPGDCSAQVSFDAPSTLSRITTPPIAGGSGKATGEACSAAHECDSGFCGGGVCCASDCGDGASCSSPSECASGQCVDGVCVSTDAGAPGLVRVEAVTEPADRARLGEAVLVRVSLSAEVDLPEVYLEVQPEGLRLEGAPSDSEVRRLGPVALGAGVPATLEVRGRAVAVGWAGAVLEAVSRAGPLGVGPLRAGVEVESPRTGIGCGCGSGGVLALAGVALAALLRGGRRRTPPNSADVSRWPPASAGAAHPRGNGFHYLER